jgi:hypothetical protein
MSRPWQATISATNGSLRATSARAWAWVIGCRRTSVPAAPMLTAPRCFSAAASLVGRKVLWPPTLTPRRKTTSATRFLSTSSLENLHSTVVAGQVPGDQLVIMIDRCRPGRFKARSEGKLGHQSQPSNLWRWLLQVDRSSTDDSMGAGIRLVNAPTGAAGFYPRVFHRASLGRSNWRKPSTAD